MLSLSLTLKAPNKICSRRHFNFLLLSFEEIRLDVLCESSEDSHEILFPLKNNKKYL